MSSRIRFALHQSVVLGVFFFLVATTMTVAADKNPVASGLAQFERMSQVERDRLQRNVAAFESLTDEQKQHYRNLHQQMEKDAKEGGQLNNLLQLYSAWLTTLTPTQRHELAKTTDPAQKYLLVQKYREEELRRQEETPAAIPGLSPPNDPPAPRPTFRPFIGPVLAPRELAAVMKELAKDGRIDFERPEDKSVIQYYGEILKASVQNSPNGSRNWPSQNLQSRLDPLIDRPEVDQLIRQNPDSKREIYARTIVYSIGSLVIAELKASRPTRQQLDQVFETLSKELQDQLSQLPRQMIDFHLERRFYENQGGDPRHRFEDYFRELERVSNELGLPPRPGFNPGGAVGPNGPGGRNGFSGGGPFGPNRERDRRPENGGAGDRPRKGNDRRDNE